PDLERRGVRGPPRLARPRPRALAQRPGRHPLDLAVRVHGRVVRSRRSHHPLGRPRQGPPHDRRHPMNKIDTGRPEYLSKAETAKLVRGALKRNFPEHAFSVTISGSSLSVTWYDGPSAKEVDEIVHGYESRGF